MDDLVPGLSRSIAIPKSNVISTWVTMNGVKN